MVDAIVACPQKGGHNKQSAATRDRVSLIDDKEKQRQREAGRNDVVERGRMGRRIDKEVVIGGVKNCRVETGLLKTQTWVSGDPCRKLDRARIEGMAGGVSGEPGSEKEARVYVEELTD